MTKGRFVVLRAAPYIKQELNFTKIYKYLAWMRAGW